MKVITNERGLTLIEVLLTLTLLSIVGALIWGVFFQGAKFTATSVTKNNLQQEANLISTTLTKFHQTMEYYTIESTEDEIKIIGKRETNDLVEVFNNNLMTYEISGTTKVGNIPINRTQIDPNKTDVLVEVIVIDRHDESNKVKINTTLSRLKSTSGKEEIEGDPENSKKLPDWSVKPVPNVDNTCKLASSVNGYIENNCKSHVLDSDAHNRSGSMRGREISGINGRYIYSKGFERIYSNVSNIENMNFYFRYGAHFDSQVTGFNNSILQIGSDIKMDSQFQDSFSMKNSKLLINVPILIGPTESRFSVDENSYVYFNDSVKFTNSTMEIKNNSRVCVFKPGSFESNRNPVLIGDNSYLYMYSPNNTSNNYVNNATYIETMSEWIDVCGN